MAETTLRVVQLVVMLAVAGGFTLILASMLGLFLGGYGIALWGALMLVIAFLGGRWALRWRTNA